MTANQHALAILEELGNKGFWGNLTFRLQHGQVVHITKEESIQPVPNNRRTYEHHRTEQ